MGFSVPTSRHPCELTRARQLTPRPLQHPAQGVAGCDVQGAGQCVAGTDFILSASSTFSWLLGRVLTQACFTSFTLQVHFPALKVLGWPRSERTCSHLKTEQDRELRAREAQLYAPDPKTPVAKNMPHDPRSGSSSGYHREITFAGPPGC